MSASRITKSYGKPLVLAAGAAIAAGLLYFLNNRLQAAGAGASSGANSGLDYYSNPNSALLGRASKDPQPTDTEIDDEWTEDELRAWLEKVRTLSTVHTKLWRGKVTGNSWFCESRLIKL
ncbi:hypothetical protein D0Z00_003622 [Geotrichum galactomycetum]|uniref:Uncharacterized protein n=1 Tax=Geotrichum galactomycetum TaxID=27317 RepID=A0ACB6V0T1_9ASCO|nr:hypothetical protein D0Z00_003622 [Geotrichum candidum]